MTREEPQLTDWEKAVGRMSIEEQEHAVRAKLVEHNPELPGSSIKFGFTDGEIRDLVIEPFHQLEDLTPVRALRNLRVLRLWNGGRVTDLSPLKGLKLQEIDFTGHQIKDLTPLQGMPLKGLGLWGWSGNDLSPLRGMPLQYANFGGGGVVQDLEPLSDMKLEALCLNHTQVSDLSPLRGMPLRRLELQSTQVTDLTPIVSEKLEFLTTRGSPIADFSPLKNSKLEELALDYNPQRDEKILRAMPHLKTVNGRPRDEFLANPEI